MDTVYQERANSRFEYWTYSEGRRVYVDQKWVKRELGRRTIILRDLNTDIKITAWQFANH